MARTLPLTKGLVALVDLVDYEWASQLKWHAADGYAVRSLPRREGQPRGRVLLHRAILGLPAWQPGGAEVDHIDRNRLNNCRSNLRIVSHQENAMNRPNTIESRPCLACGTVFRPKRSTISFCSLRCAAFSPNRVPQVRLNLDRDCPWCGRSFRPHNHTSKYCCRACANSGRSVKVGLR